MQFSGNKHNGIWATKPWFVAAKRQEKQNVCRKDKAEKKS
jgi:hypothetical protein